MEKLPTFIYFIIFEDASTKNITKFIAWEKPEETFKQKLAALKNLKNTILISKKISTKKFPLSESKASIFMEIFDKVTTMNDNEIYAKENSIELAFRYPAKKSPRHPFSRSAPLTL